MAAFCETLSARSTLMTARIRSHQPGGRRSDESLPGAAAVPRGRGAPVLRPREPGRRDGRQAGGHPLPGGGRHLGQRQVVAGQLRAAAGAAPRPDGRRRHRLARGAVPPRQRSDPARWPSALAQPACCSASRRRRGLSLAEIVETTLRMSKLGPGRHLRAGAAGRRASTCWSSSTSSRSCSATASCDGGDGGAHGRRGAIAFVNLLLEARSSASVPIYVVLTMRSDFLGDCAQFPGLGRGDQRRAVPGAAA